MVDVDSPHVQSVSSEFEDQKVQTQTQADRLEREAEDKASVAADKASAKAKSAKEEATKQAKKAKAELKKDGKKLSDNRDNPVVIGNALIWGIGAVAIGYGAYQKQSEGKLDGKLMATVAGAVGAFAVGDYFASK